MREKVEWMNCLRVTCARGCANLDGILDEDAFVYGGKADLDTFILPKNVRIRLGLNCISQKCSFYNLCYYHQCVIIHQFLLHMDILKSSFTYLIVTLT